MDDIRIRRYNDKTLNINNSDIINIDQFFKESGYIKSVKAKELLIKYFKNQRFFYCENKTYELIGADKKD